ncbi:uncharacterized protein L969DRAFT_484966 [Mixia osmundae IAM 14324]|uniref:TATA-binding protein-associated factor MOT1 n=1 Tax=Mixia osmundae (strain CBS 9802 / IAM 14324 / JCM 22182 / KY 12970) TaxID=764103 RepID=G7E196_MIXOS|nr:uncharacterized protein L969DRAFT_484966 [Mixia osmundae IAM 14324]KEI38756.1 hypothetical protein L969DRAFT_484966 [Mixia osmundae IAM 14324]GAA96606.1 hypothetical protein E5Q_03276 [Mixia osmundae IAM 14324]
MATRLDRLILLLSTGQTSTVRQTAARQLGQIAGQRIQHTSSGPAAASGPSSSLARNVRETGQLLLGESTASSWRGIDGEWQEIISLLNKIVPHLRSRNGETRIAAALAVESICRAIGVWDPLPPRSTDLRVTSAAQTEPSDALTDFNALQIMRERPHLLATAGGEFAPPLTASDREAQQKSQKALASEFGLDFAGSRSEDLSIGIDMAKELAEGEQAASASAHTNGAPAKTLSARELNALKRKRKAEAKETSSKKRAIEATIAQQADNIDNKKDEQTIAEPPVIGGQVAIKAEDDMPDLSDVSADTWPFHAIAESLADDLTDPIWTIRHGAALGLTEILRSQGASGGMSLALSDADNRAAHQRWCSELITVILEVLLRDRFGDYLGDSVKAPVREAASRTLASLIAHCPSFTLASTFDALEAMIKQDDQKSVWEVRHAGLLGLRYLVESRQDILQDDALLLNRVVALALTGLKDKDDDVRGVAAAALLPIVGTIGERLPKATLDALLEMLWSCIQQAHDDLSSSVADIIQLLTALMTSSAMLASVSREHLIARLPALYPFLRHTITSVRASVINAITVMIPVISSGEDVALPRLIWRNIAVETRLSIREQSMAAWQVFLAESTPTYATSVIDGIVDTCAGLLISPLQGGLPMDFYQITGYAIAPVDKTLLSQDMTLITSETLFACRLDALQALAQLHAKNPNHSWQRLSHYMTHLSDPSASRRVFSALLLAALARASLDAEPETSALGLQCRDRLTAALPDSYDEIAADAKRLSSHCEKATKSLANHHVEDMPPAKLSLSIRAQGLMTLLQSTSAKLAQTSKKAASQMHELSQTVLRLHTQYAGDKSTYDIRVAASLASACVAFGAIPAKLNALVPPLIASLKSETDPRLQQSTALAIAQLIRRLTADLSKQVPCTKLIKNVANLVCQDTLATPLFAEHVADQDRILYDIATTTEGTSVTPDPRSLLVVRGARFAMAELSADFGDKLFDELPLLWQVVSDDLVSVCSQPLDAQQTALASDHTLGQKLIDGLAIATALLPVASTQSRVRLASLLPTITSLLRSSYAVLRSAAAKAIATICDLSPATGLPFLIEHCLADLSDPLNLYRRQGMLETIARIVDIMDIRILPYIVFLVVPTLGRTTDGNEAVRLLAARVFASIIKLVPLEAEIQDPADLPASLIARRDDERRFLSQLIDGSTIAEYVMPITVKAELRSYQREGVSWLAFLHKYQLHGILCDDMGLGKTLQSICILASKHFERAEKHTKSASPETVHLPSLVVCPSTLTGHWQHEIETYAPDLRPLIFGGDPLRRSQLKGELKKADVVIASYNTISSEIDYLATLDFNYCVLDEGHVIKSSKAKLSKAVKRLKAEHRLVLSGTPIQNNVLELWSLFDFLMPGFLGSEASFSERYSRPIAASKDAKKSSAEQAKGALALEALHKQVLPFILRRLKENVLQDLPPKIIQDYQCELSPLQRDLYSSLGQSNEDGSNADDGKQHVFQTLQYLRKLVNHPSLVLDASNPQHRTALANLAAAKNELEHAPKLEALRQLLWDCGIGLQSQGKAKAVKSDIEESIAAHRVLVFCQTRSMLDIIESMLFRKHMPTVSYMRLDGAIPSHQRFAIVKTFNRDPSIDVLLLTTHVGGLGLNLTSADTVIFVEHDLNPMKDLQAMDRAHRLGQKRTVNVYRLITKDTLEEQIMGLQRFKTHVASTVISQQNSQLASLETDKLLDLFTPAGDAPKQEKQGRITQQALLAALEEAPDGDNEDLA